MIMFPKPSKRVKKSKRELDPDYVAWIHGWPCVVPGCGRPTPVHAHHTVPRSRLGADRTCVPLCHDHHVGDSGIHVMGILHWQKQYGVDLEAVVEVYNQAYDAGEKGPFHHQQVNLINFAK